MYGKKPMSGNIFGCACLKHKCQTYASSKTKFADAGSYITHYNVARVVLTRKGEATAQEEEDVYVNTEEVDTNKEFFHDFTYVYMSVSKTNALQPYQVVCLYFPKLTHGYTYMLPIPETLNSK